MWCEDKVLTGLLFRKFSMLADVVTQITARHEVDHQIKVVAILKRVVHVDQESMWRERPGQRGEGTNTYG